MHTAPAGPAARLPPSDPVIELVQTQHERLRRFVRRYIRNPSDIDDITQQALAEMSLSYERFRGASKPSTWLFGIAMNLIRNHLSRAPERRLVFESIESLATEACLDPAPPVRAEWRQMVSIVDQAMADMPKELRTMLQMVAVEELSYEETARQLALPIGTVRSRVSRARAHLRRRVQARGVCLDA